VAIRRKALPPEHPDLAQSLDNLGLLFQKRGEYARARPYLEEALAIRGRALGPAGHSDIARSLGNLGLLLQNQGEYAKALPYYERALAMRERLYPEARFPDGHPDLAASLDNLGLLLQNQGEYAKALPYYERALAMRERLYPGKHFPTGHPHLAASLDILGVLLLARGDYKRALPYIEQALAMRQRLYPEARYPQGHSDVAKSLCNHARACLASGDTAGYRQACAVLLERFGQTQDPQLANGVARTCALAPKAVADLGQAVELAKSAVATRKDSYNELNTLGGILVRAGRTEEAIARLKEAIRLRRGSDQVSDELLLALAHHDLGQAKASRRWLDKATAWFDRGRASVWAGGLSGAGASGPLALLPGLVSEVPDPRARQLGWETWLELQVLRREAERVLKPVKP
jgi:tetratricopeptide (TPR) repeat protein